MFPALEIHQKRTLWESFVHFNLPGCIQHDKTVSIAQFVWERKIHAKILQKCHAWIDEYSPNPREIQPDLLRMCYSKYPSIWKAKEILSWTRINSDKLIFTNKNQIRQIWWGRWLESNCHWEWERCLIDIKSIIAQSKGIDWTEFSTILSDSK